MLAADICSNPSGSAPTLPEELGREASARLLEEIYRGGCVDSTSQSLAEELELRLPIDDPHSLDHASIPCHAPANPAIGTHAPVAMNTVAGGLTKINIPLSVPRRNACDIDACTANVQHSTCAPK